MIKVQGIEIPNRVDELTVEQFDYLSAIDANESLDVIEKWIAKFKYLGVDEDVFDEMSTHPWYSHDEDDDFDCTYANIYFKVPENHKDFVAIMNLNEGHKPSEQWAELFATMEAMKK